LLYTWAAANIGASATDTERFEGVASTRQGICPSGWHLPSDYEWSELEKEIATNPGNYSEQTTPYGSAWSYSSTRGWRPDDGTGTTSWGRQMKSQTAVVDNDRPTNGTSNGSTANGFDALLVGNMGDGEAGSYSRGAYFWSSSSSSSSNAWYRVLFHNYTGVSRVDIYKYYMFSVRCKKD
jgi:uncharacterized protein (TIGR02145 family)